jgi:Transglutaminase-like superfamily
LTAWSTRNFWSLLNRLREIRLVIHIGLFAAVAPLLVRCSSLDRLDGALERPNRPVPPSSQRMCELTSLIDRVLWAGRPLLQSGCLVRGLTRYYFLRRAGADVSLCFGIALNSESAIGHCWLEARGEPFLELRDPRPLFREMYRVPSQP